MSLYDLFSSRILDNLYQPTWTYTTKENAMTDTQRIEHTETTEETTTVEQPTPQSDPDSEGEKEGE